ncbi:PREDICTED: basic proline-rich protein-like [Pseudopodoces humilis]|uniref:basic proline-rich protein-like n=1 Tax=Pseudopodoces humilis TaxID=181119 RepID=UPI0006B7DE66|nr:PREDICTED: basic proline-rich protein-like [Pseudopodoces humilis]
MKLKVSISYTKAGETGFPKHRKLRKSANPATPDQPLGGKHKEALGHHRALPSAPPPPAPGPALRGACPAARPPAAAGRGLRGGCSPRHCPYPSGGGCLLSPQPASPRRPPPRHARLGPGGEGTALSRRLRRSSAGSGAAGADVSSSGAAERGCRRAQPPPPPPPPPASGSPPPPRVAPRFSPRLPPRRAFMAGGGDVGRPPLPGTPRGGTAALRAPRPAPAAAPGGGGPRTSPRGDTCSPAGSEGWPGAQPQPEAGRGPAKAIAQKSLGGPRPQPPPSLAAGKRMLNRPVPAETQQREKAVSSAKVQNASKDGQDADSVPSRHSLALSPSKEKWGPSRGSSSKQYRVSFAKKLSGLQSLIGAFQNGVANVSQGTFGNIGQGKLHIASCNCISYESGKYLVVLENPQEDQLLVQNL